MPTGWKQVSLGSLATLVTSGSRGWARHYCESGSPFIRITNLSRETIRVSTRDLQHVCVPGDDPEARRTELKENDLLVSITADIGIIGFIDDSFPSPAYINQHIALVRFGDDGLTARFAAYQLAAAPTQRTLRSGSDQGAKAGMNLSAIRDISLVLPPPNERRSITASISGVDDLLSVLDRLIAKKEAVKQGAMQQLLTGQTRLPGFARAWEQLTLAKLGSFSKGQGIRKDDVTDAGIPCIRYGEIYTRHHDVIREFYSFIARDIAATSRRLTPGDIIFAASGETAAEIGKCVAFVGTGEAYVGSDTVVLTPGGHDSRFLSRLLNSPSVASQKARYGQGDAVVHISARNLGRVQVSIPELDEQRAIAEVLTDMDDELEALKARRDKTQALKQGMMQELLSGRIRLV